MLLSNPPLLKLIRPIHLTKTHLKPHKIPKRLIRLIAKKKNINIGRRIKDRRTNGRRTINGIRTTNGIRIENGTIKAKESKVNRMGKASRLSQAKANTRESRNGTRIINIKNQRSTLGRLQNRKSGAREAKKTGKTKRRTAGIRTKRRTGIRMKRRSGTKTKRKTGTNPERESGIKIKRTAGRRTPRINKRKNSDSIIYKLCISIYPNMPYHLTSISACHLVPSPPRRCP